MISGRQAVRGSLLRLYARVAHASITTCALEAGGYPHKNYCYSCYISIVLGTRSSPLSESDECRKAPLILFLCPRQNCKAVQGCGVLRVHGLLRYCTLRLSTRIPLACEACNIVPVLVGLTIAGQGVLVPNRMAAVAVRHAPETPECLTGPPSGRLGHFHLVSGVEHMAIL